MTTRKHTSASKKKKTETKPNQKKVAAARLSGANATAAGVSEDLEKAKHRSWAMERAAFDLTEGKNREFYDKPCRPVFGACCARDQPDGGLSIICG